MGRANPQQVPQQVAKQSNHNQQNSQHQILNHFSHIHPLTLVNIQNQNPTSPNATCRACMHPCKKGQIYTCTSCNYFLHPSCAKTPRTMQHPSHPSVGHILTLTTTPSYPNGVFSCDACGKFGKAFSLHCTKCEFDLHIPCANLRPQVQNPSHPHPLALTYASPYGALSFACNICGKNETGSVWLYNCRRCEFDSHVECVYNCIKMPSGSQRLGRNNSLGSFGRQIGVQTQGVVNQVVRQGAPIMKAMVQGISRMGLNNNKVGGRATVGAYGQNNYNTAAGGGGNGGRAYGQSNCNTGSGGRGGGGAYDQINYNNSGNSTGDYGQNNYNIGGGCDVGDYGQNDYNIDGGGDYDLNNYNIGDGAGAEDYGQNNYNVDGGEEHDLNNYNIGGDGAAEDYSHNNNYNTDSGCEDYDLNNYNTRASDGAEDYGQNNYNTDGGAGSGKYNLNDCSTDCAGAEDYDLKKYNPGGGGIGGGKCDEDQQTATYFQRIDSQRSNVTEGFEGGGDGDSTKIASSEQMNTQENSVARDFGGARDGDSTTASPEQGNTQVNNVAGGSGVRSMREREMKTGTRVNRRQLQGGNQINKNQQPPQLQVLNHFSHIHPLKFVNIQLQLPPTPIICKACMHPCNKGAQIFSCAPCKYVLHTSCAKTPRTIQHPSHPGRGHVLALTPTPPYHSGCFSCDACGKQGKAFSFHCTRCEFDLHVPCANLLPQTRHPSHQHPLALTFGSPYGGLPFACNICNKKGGPSVWLYRCGMCEFDVHVECAYKYANPQRQEMSDQWMANLRTQMEIQTQGNPSTDGAVQDSGGRVDASVGSSGGDQQTPYVLESSNGQDDNVIACNVTGDFEGANFGDPTAGSFDQMNSQGDGFSGDFGGVNGGDIASAFLENIQAMGGSAFGAGGDGSGLDFLEQINGVFGGVYEP